MNIIKNKAIILYKLAIYVLAVALIPPLTSTALAATTGTGDIYNAIFQGSRDREYKIYVPQSYDGSTPVPMIMALRQFQ